MIIFLIFILAFTGGFKTLRTRRLEMHLLRGGCVVFANTCFFMGLASMPLADAVARTFITPIIVTILSAYLLGERVGKRRWAAVIIGFFGTVMITQPSIDNFNLGLLFPLLAAMFIRLLDA